MPRWAAPGTPSSHGLTRVPPPSVRKQTSEGLLPPGLPPAPPGPHTSAIGRLGYYALLVYLFFYLSRALELTLPQLKLTMILNLVFLGAAVFSGQLLHSLRSRICMLLAGFYCWMVLSSPFSVWRGGSAATLVETARALVLLAAILALTATARDCLRLMSTVGFAATAAGMMGVVLGSQDSTKRFVLPGGSFADPNGYCVMLYVGLPFLWLAARNAPRLWQKLLYTAATLPVLAAGVATGSRTGFVALCAMVGLLFLRLPTARKLRLVATAGAALAVASLVLSPYIRERYTTWFDVGAGEEEISEEEMKYLRGSVGSAESRLYLFRRSLELTLRHPLFGVGPGMFQVAEDLDAKAQGRSRGAWHQTHNTYTQVSVEAGIPAFLLYLAALFGSLRILWRLRRRLSAPASAGSRRAYNAGVYLEVAFLGALTAALFLSIAYVGLLYVLVGLILALERAVAQEYLGRGGGPNSRRPAPLLERGEPFPPPHAWGAPRQR